MQIVHGLFPPSALRLLWDNIEQTTLRKTPAGREIAPIALLSFQAAGQIVASRILGINEIPTVVITSLLADLFSDPRLMAMPIMRGNPKRNNRVVGFTLTLVASIAGGWILKGTGQVQPVLWIVFSIKMIISFSWLGWKEQKVGTM